MSTKSPGRTGVLAALMGMVLLDCAHNDTAPLLQEATRGPLSVVYQRPSANVPDSGMAPRIHVERILLGTDVLLLELRHTYGGKPPSHDTVAPDLTITANGCPATVPQHDGELTFAGTGKLALSLDGLPQGLLFMEVTAFNALGAVRLVHEGRRIREALPNESSEVKVETAHDGTPSVAGVVEATCPKPARAP